MRRPVLGLLIAGLALACAGVAYAATHTIKVTPKNFEAIFNRGDSRPVSSYAFVNGPAKPPLGKGSLQLSTVDAAGKQQHLETQQQGTPIGNIERPDRRALLRVEVLLLAGRVDGARAAGCPSPGDSR